MSHYEMTLRGGLAGNTWMPGSRGALSITVDLSREIGRFTEKPTLRELLDHVLMEHGGDFQGAEFTADSFIEIRAHNGKSWRSRMWDLTAFPSISDMVNADVFTHDYAECEDD